MNRHAFLTKDTTKRTKVRVVATLNHQLPYNISKLRIKFFVYTTTAPKFSITTLSSNTLYLSNGNIKLKLFFYP